MLSLEPLGPNSLNQFYQYWTLKHSLDLESTNHLVCVSIFKLKKIILVGVIFKIIGVGGQLKQFFNIDKTSGPALIFPHD